MDHKDIQEALKNLQQFLLDEYGWDTQTAIDSPAESEPPEEPTHQLESAYKAYRLGSVSS